MSLALENPKIGFAGRRLLRSAPGIIGAVTSLVIWEAACRLLDVPKFILPAPSEVMVGIYSDFVTGLIFPHFMTTFIEVVAGFLIAMAVGVTFGTVIGLVPLVDRTIYPLVLAFQTVPKVAIAPLLIIWFGYGLHSKVVMAALIAFFPILVNTIVGLRTTDSRRLLLMQALKATPLQVYLKVRLPSMLPFLFASMEVAIVLAIIGAVVGEFVGASVGLGSLIIQRQAVVDVVGVFSVLFYLSFMGLAMSMVVKIFADRLTWWAISREKFDAPA